MKFRTRVKICGIGSLDEALYIAELGCDSIGLVFYRKSPRFVDTATASHIRQNLPPFVTVTALLLDESDEWIREVVDSIKPDCLQFHGEESAQSCERWQLPYIKAIPMGSVEDAKAYASHFPAAQGFLLDSNVAGRRGGSGDTFDWSKIPSSFSSPLVLAGGLNPGNIAEAIIQVKPWAVDVSSGVEASKGLKDRRLIKQFFDEVKRGDANA
ncbi:MAG: phosphoribosylanthranilate isomerase [Gammaproteobacteria bacterium]|nr:phosphoribosylanthranilate isomerase [Gammaproteobacteria bacterium]